MGELGTWSEIMHQYAGRAVAEESYRNRLVYYHYFKDTEEFNKIHYATLTDPYCALRSRLFTYASSPWEGETLEL